MDAVEFIADDGGVKWHPLQLQVEPKAHGASPQGLSFSGLLAGLAGVGFHEGEQVAQGRRREWVQIVLLAKPAGQGRGGGVLVRKAGRGRVAVAAVVAELRKSEGADQRPMGRVRGGAAVPKAVQRSA